MVTQPLPKIGQSRNLNLGYFPSHPSWAHTGMGIQMGETFICYLSNLEAPIKALTKDHYIPHSLAPTWIKDNPDNIHYAHKTINFIKADLMPCDWVDQRINLAYRALMRWNLKKADAKFVEKAIAQWEAYATDPCKDCLLKGQCR